MDRLQRRGSIVPFLPAKRPPEQFRRRLWLRPQVDEWVRRKGATRAEVDFHAQVRSLLKAFLTGGDFDDDALLKPMLPDETVFEIRITFHPQERIFGAFLRTGEFVATNRRDRKGVDGKFASQIDRCRKSWKALFPSHPMVKAARSEMLRDFGDV